MVKVAPIVSQDPVPMWIRHLVDNYTDVFPGQLPHGHPPARASQVEVEMRQMRFKAHDIFSGINDGTRRT